ncbi:methyl-accepting chemotaxis protein [Marinobacterium weihaiense]|uniref:Methyl-accepting transducer domain-containing protein n=1 Tax=Marinobacterium weihaiense TaxID=2851016 RepID=A0ABS6MD64_9GAMM|nr:methyl-accepting chemotaxis protein [Marinobacterium weihaiense]MBV0934235.1 hypothetical protein [Marinobacterium weihaiense]
MNISTLARTSLLVLLLLLAGLSAAVIWSLMQLGDAFTNSTRYRDYTLQIQQHVEAPARRYLATGNAAELTTLNQGIENLISANLTNLWLPLPVREQIDASLQTLHDTVIPKLRSAGKLAEPQALLVNNERELAYGLNSLHEYAFKALDARPGMTQQAMRYLQLNTRLLSELHNLTLLRQRYVEVQDPEALASIHQQLSRMDTLTAELAALPALGIFKTSEPDPMAELMGWDTRASRIELGEEARSQVQDLINRYPKELSNASKFLQHKLQGEAMASNYLSTLADELTRIERSLSESFEQTLLQTYALLAIAIVLVLTMVLLLGLLLYRLAGLIVTACHHITLLAAGKLHEPLILNSRFNEARQLNEALLQLQNYFKQLIDQVYQQTHRLGALQVRATNSSTRLEAVVQQQQQQTHASALKMDQLSTSYQEVAASAVTGSEATLQVQAQIDQGGERIRSTSTFARRLSEEAKRTESSINRLREDTLAISEALEVIHGFADQTNLLALNAAIEAARAGASGRGFAVVADEVRNLANSTTTSAEQIQGILNRLEQTSLDAMDCVSQQKQLVSQTVTAVEETRSSMETINVAMREIADMNAMVAASTEQQSQTTAQIRISINDSAALASDSAHEASGNRQLALELETISQSLNGLVSRFQQ